MLKKEGAFHLVKISGISGSAVNGTTFYRSEIPLLLPPKYPGFFRKWKAPRVLVFTVPPTEMIVKLPGRVCGFPTFSVNNCSVTLFPVCKLCLPKILQMLRSVKVTF